jgi:hypothetical protein
VLQLWASKVRRLHTGLPSRIDPFGADTSPNSLIRFSAAQGTRRRRTSTTSSPCTPPLQLLLIRILSSSYTPAPSRRLPLKVCIRLPSSLIYYSSDRMYSPVGGVGRSARREAAEFGSSCAGSTNRSGKKKKSGDELAQLRLIN